MKIRKQITLTFAGLTFLLQLLSFVIIYLLSVNYTHKTFTNRLFERAYITAEKHFKEDEFAKQVYNSVLEKYLRKIEGEEEIVLDVALPETDSYLQSILSPNLLEQLYNGEDIIFAKDGKRVVGIYFVDNQGTFVVLISAYDTVGAAFLNNLLKLLLGILTITTILVFVIGRGFARQIVSPVSHIINRVNKIRSTNLSQRLEPKKGADEISELVITFNQMLERLDSSFDMQKSFIRNASHELRNPITAILCETEITLSKERAVKDYVSSFTKVESEVERLKSLTDNLIQLSQTDFDFDQMAKEPIALGLLLNEIKEELGRLYGTDRIKICLPENAANLVAHGVTGLLTLSISNVIENACKFSNGEVVEAIINREGEQVIVKVKDRGIGIPEAELPNLFRPFYRAGNAASYKGSGIGLSFVEKIIRLHGGTISINSVLNQGTTVTLVLPAYNAE